MRRAASRATCTAGSSSATSTPMIAITTSSSTSVKAREARRDMLLFMPLVSAGASGNAMDPIMVRDPVATMDDRQSHYSGSSTREAGHSFSRYVSNDASTNQAASSMHAETVIIKSKS